jgi:hypothetical protein
MMPGLVIGILVLTLMLSVVATAALCTAIERHRRHTLRREVFGLRPLNFP